MTQTLITMSSSFAWVWIVELTTLFRALAHPVRWKIVNMLLKKPLRWDEIYSKLKEEGYVLMPTHLNFHMDVLVKTHVVVKKRERGEIVYAISPEVSEFLGQLLRSKTKIALRGA